MNETPQNKGELSDKPAAEAARSEPTRPSSDRVPATSALQTEEPPAPLRRALRCVDCAVRRGEPYGVVLAVVLLFISVLTYCSDQSGRVEQRTVEAWQLLLHTAPGNSGKREALEYLNKEDGLICIVGCWPAWKGRKELVEIKLVHRRNRLIHPVMAARKPAVQAPSGGRIRSGHTEVNLLNAPVH